MEVKVLFYLAVLGLVSLPAVSATAQQQQGEWCEIWRAWHESAQSYMTSHSGDQCVSRVEFDRVAAQLNTWQNLTALILKRFLLENPGILKASMPGP